MVGDKGGNHKIIEKVETEQKPDMGRSPRSDESGLKKGPWTPEEDQTLVKHIQKHGHGSWRALPKLAGLNRCGKSCRLRWTNYLRPDIKRGKFSQEEEQTILNLHSILGNKWSAISNHLPGRTDNEIKNFWNTHLKKKLIQMGFDPMTHRPRTDIFSSLPHLIALAALLETHSSWEEQTAEIADLQYVQHLDTINLLNSFSTHKENQVLNSNQLDQLNLNAPIPFQPLGSAAIIDDSIPFSHLPELQTPCSFQAPLNDKYDVNTVHAFAGDVFSASDCGTPAGPSSFWPDLLEDPLFQDIPTQF